MDMAVILWYTQADSRKQQSVRDGHTREVAHMTTIIAIQVTPQGLLIPHTALQDWNVNEVEAVRRKQTILIRPKRDATDTRSRVRQALRAAGLLYQPDWKTPPDVSPEERARLARKLAQGQPLSEIIIAERDDRA